MKMDSTSSKVNSASQLNKGPNVFEGELDELKEDSASRTEVQSYVWIVGLDELSQLGALTLTVDLDQV